MSRRQESDPIHEINVPVGPEEFARQCRAARHERKTVAEIGAFILAEQVAARHERMAEAMARSEGLRWENMGAKDSVFRQDYWISLARIADEARGD